ncbi:hypothetical protein HPOKI673_00560 [Helicobacter pylori oki673]|nr:hypothetical protein HPOKI154_00565 [Helicobacter pylori oki154]AHN42687.1 hypothetical protein HPOKI673_00560 [Helicobacter pylori oki673]AHN44132.1 hypothetical protein HPOKI828_00560 [Helicobacter pylori oki828]
MVFLPFCHKVRVSLSKERSFLTKTLNANTKGSL